MKYLVRNITIPVSKKDDIAMLRRLASRELGVSEKQVSSISIFRRSLDARKKNDLRYVYTVECEVSGVVTGSKNVSAGESYRYDIPRPESIPDNRPVVAGFGPAGMFAALVLAEAGLKPIVLERGGPVEQRSRAVEEFWRGGALDTECNVQFGEGGAGTFSDGKLNTGTSDLRLRWVFSQFVSAGAPRDIMYDAKPHIGTDLLPGIVKALRQRIIALGGEVRFFSRLESLDIRSGTLCGVNIHTPEGGEYLECDRLILAVGHSARDTFRMLLETGVPMAPKAFSMGARIEHLQTMTDMAQYGADRASLGLPPADYKLSCFVENNTGGKTGVYTFCMCPGGQVVAAASESGRIVTNGMSRRARNGENSNAAVLVSAAPEIFPYDGVLGGMLWQQEIERRAFEAAGGTYRAPAQLVGDFLAGRPSAGQTDVAPSYLPGVSWGDIRRVLPPVITGAMAKALPVFGRKLRGFDVPGAVLTAPETRSSSPVRILRNDGLMSDIRGLFPCGEGAGYAGGISSAAVDGVRCAEAVIRSY